MSASIGSNAGRVGDPDVEPVRRAGGQWEVGGGWPTPAGLAVGLGRDLAELVYLSLHVGVPRQARMLLGAALLEATVRLGTDWPLPQVPDCGPHGDLPAAVQQVHQRLVARLEQTAGPLRLDLAMVARGVRDALVCWRDPQQWKRLQREQLFAQVPGLRLDGEGRLVALPQRWP